MARRERTQRTFPFLAATLVVSSALCALLVATVPGPKTASADTLPNGDFETWTNETKAAQWTLFGSGSTIARAGGEGNPGSAARIQLVSPNTVLVHGALPASFGDQISVAIEAKGDPTANVALQLQYFLEDGTTRTSGPGAPMSAGPAYQDAAYQATVDVLGTTDVILRVFISGSGEVLLDNATLTITAATPTPFPTATPTEDPGSDTPTPTATVDEPTVTPIPGGSSPEATSSPTRTPTPSRTPTGTRTPSPTREPTSTRTPTPRPPPSGPKGAPTQPLPVSTATPQSGGFGGLLQNGDFEGISDGKPLYWEKFGGTMFAAGDAGGGSYAACLESETNSLKWLYQIITIEPGAWYAGAALAKLSGPGSASIRISWYSSADGSGSQILADEGSHSSESAWGGIAIGPLQAPDDARSARFRLSLLPSGSATACFDNASLVETEAPPASALPPTGTPVSPAVKATPGGTVTSRSASPTSRSGGGTAPSSRPAPSPSLGSPSGSIRISEFLSDPAESGRDADYEWVELVNTGDQPVDLAGWNLGDANRSQALPSFVLLPNAYVIAAGSQASLPASVSVIRTATGEIGNGLGNTGDLIRLVDPSGNVTDEMSYGDDDSIFDPAPAAPGAGKTLGVIEPMSDPASENWALTQHPTPGEKNDFSPKPLAGVSGTKDAPPMQEGTGSRDDEVKVVVEGGGSAMPWVVLALLAGGSAGIATVAAGPRVRELRKRIHRG